MYIMWLTSLSPSPILSESWKHGMKARKSEKYFAEPFKQRTFRNETNIKGAF